MSNATKTEATETRYYTISNIAGGDLRRFRTDRDGRPSDASIRHARAQAMGYSCSDSDVADQIAQAIADAEHPEVELHEMAPATSAAPALLLALPRRR